VSIISSVLIKPLRAAILNLCSIKIWLQWSIVLVVLRMILSAKVNTGGFPEHELCKIRNMNIYYYGCSKIYY